MNLYDIIPENLFSVLVSKNKNLYVKTLFVLLDAFKQHLKISKDELISMINAQLDDDIISADFTEEELLESEQSISGKAHFLVRKLKSTGWILIETENDFREYITVPGFSYKIIQLLYDVANVSETENFAYVYSTYSSLEIAKKTRDPFEMITALNDGAERTERLVESLKSVYHSITYYNQQLINTLNVNNVLHSHYEIFQEDVILKILRPLKIKDSVPKYKIPIQNILKLWIAEEDVIEDMVQYRLSKQNDNDEGEIRNDILRKIHYIIDTYDMRVQASNTNDVCVNIGELFGKIVNEFSVYPKKPPQKEIKESFRILENHNIIRRLDESYDDIECRFVVLPSILVAVPNEKCKTICDMLKAEEDKNEGTDEITAC